MRMALRGLLVAACALAVSAPVFAAAPRAVPSRPVVVANWDLQGKAPARQMEAKQLRALLMYLSPEGLPDVVALHSVGRQLSQGGTNAPLAVAARSLSMYYAFQPVTDALGTALLSRFPVKNATCLSGASGAALGIKAEVQAGRRTFISLLVRPPSAALDQAAIDVVAKAIQAQPKAQWVVLASFNADGRASQALGAWTKAGVVDAATKPAAAATYPAAKPAERLDFVLLSPGLRSQVGGYEVMNERRFVTVSDHLPVAALLRP